MTKKEWTPEELQKLAAGIRLVAQRHAVVDGCDRLERRL